MTNYEKMVTEARNARKARITAMVKNGWTRDAALYALKREADQHFAIASARAKCGITKRATTSLGPLLAQAMKEV